MENATGPTNEKDLQFLSDKPTAEDAIGVHSEIAKNLKRIIMGGFHSKVPLLITSAFRWAAVGDLVAEKLLFH